MNTARMRAWLFARRVRVLRSLGLLILVAGLGSATAIWVAQDRLERRQRAGPALNPAAAPLEPDDSRRYTRDVELYYGKTGLLLDKWQRWFDQATHGKPLAWNLAFMSALSGAGCLFLARLVRVLPTAVETDRPPG